MYQKKTGEYLHEFELEVITYETKGTIHNMKN